MQGSRALLASLCISIADFGEVGRAGARAEMREQRIVPGIALEPVYGCVRLMQIAERDRARRARILACRRDFIRADRPVVTFGGAAGAADALNAIRAFLHDAARTHSHFGIFLRLVGFEPKVGIFLAVGVSEEVETPYFVRAIRFAKTCTDATIVDLHVEALAVVH